MHRANRLRRVRHAGGARETGPGEQLDRPAVGARVAAEDHRLVHALADPDQVLEVPLDVAGVGERPRDQHRVDAGRVRQQLQRRRIPDGEDDLRGHIHRIARRPVGRKHALDGGAGLGVEYGHREPVVLADIGQPRAGAPRRGEDAHSGPFRQPVGEEREGGADIDHVLLVLAGQDPATAKHRVVGARGPGQRRRV